MKTSVKITFHIFINQIKGIFHIHNCKFNEVFEKKLKEVYPFNENSIEASFSKSINSNIMAVHLFLNFNLQEQPYNIYILGLPSDTAVYKYYDRPLICHNWYNYGPTKSKMQTTMSLSKYRRRRPYK